MWRDESVSRVLSARPKARGPTIYLGPNLRAGSINLPASAGRAARCAPEGPRTGLFGLSTPEVYPAGVVTQPLVRSYRTFSPLPKVSWRLSDLVSSQNDNSLIR